MPEIIAWSQARALGLQDYFSGKPCKRGHVSLRTVSSSMCKQCASESNKAWMTENSDDREVWRKGYVAENIERVRGWRNDWHKNNLEKSRETNRRAIAKILAKDPDVYRRRAAKWAKENPEKARANIAIRRARMVCAEGSFTTKDVSSLFKKQNGLCAYCFIKVGKSYHIDHITPLVRGGSNWPENLQICCKPCNLRKGSKTNDEFLRYLAEKVAA